MANTYKTLGQVAPAANTSTDLYTVPSSTATVCSTLAVCNRGASAVSIRVAVRPAGAALANQHYIIYNSYVSQNDSLFLTLGITLATTDVVTVYADSSSVSFSLFGSEIT